ncbi:MAG: hypothetical protein ACYDHY_19635 [Acidiferrobacterales bacterium]
MPTNPRISSERGFATLLAVLFLLIVIGFAVLVATRMSGSDVTDTSLAQQSTSALFLAESGIERAAALFVSGTPCGNKLAPGVYYPLGQGKKFTLNAWYSTDFSGVTPLPPGECRVQSEGDVGTTRRTVQAILRLPAQDGIVVGNKGTALLCNAAGCTPTSSTGTSQNLVSVTCPDSNDCIAVGDTGGAFQWNGSTWSALPPSVITRYIGISCVPGSASNCWAVGVDQFRIFRRRFAQLPYLLYWNGSVWSSVQYPSTFTGVSCAGTAGSGTCTATTSGTSYLTGNGTSYLTGNANSTYSLNAVSCDTPSDCWTTETYGGGGNWYFDHLSGASAGPEDGFYAGGNARALTAISCDAGTDCWATGADKPGKQSNFAYFNGTSWASVPWTSAIVTLYGIDCPSQGECWAVGAGGTVLQGSGTGLSRTWASVSSGTGEQLNAVSFTSGSQVVVIGWHEMP